MHSNCLIKVLDVTHLDHYIKGTLHYVYHPLDKQLKEYILGREEKSKKYYKAITFKWFNGHHYGPRFVNNNIINMIIYELECKYLGIKDYF